MTRRHSNRHRAEPDVAAIGALVGHPARSAILFALLDGGRLPASELAARAGASAQATSGHLAGLLAGGMLVAEAAGRQRLFSLAAPEVAHALEALAAIARPVPIVALRQNETMQRLREARTCYDHLAGRLGVAVTDRLRERGAIRISEADFELTPRGERFFRSLEIDVESTRAARRHFARACLDWTERRPHLAGSLGASLLQRFIAAKWVTPNALERSLRITPHGRAELARRFGIGLER
jgi:DNA-binding transcriptional ArsR family regulator